MQSCIGKLAASIGMDCSSPIVGGYTGRGLIIVLDPSKNQRFIFDPSRKNVVIDTLGMDEVLFFDNSMFTNPLDGSNTTGTSENGIPEFTKQVNGRIPMRGADVSTAIVEPLIHGNFAIFLEKRETSLLRDGKGIEIVGAIVPARCVDPSTVVRNENENGGSISFSLQTTEPYFEVDIAISDQGEMTNHQWFDMLLNPSASSLAMFAEH